MAWKLGDMTALEKWRKANPNWRKENAAKAAKTKARKKILAEAKLAARKIDPTDPLYNPSVFDVMREIHRDHGDWSWCNECEHDDLPGLICYPGRRFINHSKPCLCRRFTPK